MKKLIWMTVALFVLSGFIMAGGYALQRAAEPLAISAVETVSGGEFERRDDEGVVMNLPQGRLASRTGDGARIPDGFPVGPPPGNAELASVTHLAGEDGTMVSVTWNTGASVADLEAHYLAALGDEVQRDDFTIPILLHTVSLLDEETGTVVSLTRTFGQVTVTGTTWDRSAVAE